MIRHLRRDESPRSIEREAPAPNGTLAGAAGDAGPLHSCSVRSGSGLRGKSTGSCNGEKPLLVEAHSTRLSSLARKAAKASSAGQNFAAVFIDSQFYELVTRKLRVPKPF
eukprot:2644152-Amphidinium_carterae.1